MTFDTALRATEILLALALAQSTLEHLWTETRARAVFFMRLFGCVILLSGTVVWLGLALLCATSLVLLHRFQGPYNGGSDKMGILVLACLTGAHLAPTLFWQQMALAYLAVQLTLSYFISGRIKLVNPDWRSGQALHDVFAFSAYPVSEDLRGFASHPQLLRVMSWAVILFEIAFPVALMTAPTLWIALGIASLFHLANASLFGLNRFVWIWLAAYPSLLWFQERVLG